MGQMEAHKFIVNMADNYGNVFDKDQILLPDIHDQKPKIIKFLNGFAKITKYEDFKVGEGEEDK
jgi:hypothetical protein